MLTFHLYLSRFAIGHFQHRNNEPDHVTHDGSRSLTVQLPIAHDSSRLDYRNRELSGPIVSHRELSGPKTIFPDAVAGVFPHEFLSLSLLPCFEFFAYFAIHVTTLSKRRNNRTMAGQNHKSDANEAQ